MKIQKRKELITMKATRENILHILREHPGLRKREIASYLNCHHFTIITTLHEMEEDGLVRTKYHHDPAQMEFYDRYFITDEGAQLLIFLEI
jgi:predicted transcriptional regulator